MADVRILRAKVITHATGHLLSLETCRDHLEVVPIDGDSDNETHPDDALILGMLDAAVAHAEQFTGLSILVRTWEAAMDELPADGFELPRPPFLELLSFSAVNDSDGEFDPAAYVVDDYGTPEQPVVLRPATSWPTVTKAPNTVKVRYRSGYQSEEDPDSDAPPLPRSLRAATLLVLGHLYENREDSVEKALASIPNGAEALMRPLRVRLGMA